MSAVAGPAARTPPRRRAPSTRWELRKLRRPEAHLHRPRLRRSLVPLIFVVALLADAAAAAPTASRSASYVRDSGLAIPLVGLFFGAFWFFPLITALVAGDIVATEDSNGTLKTILTRSVERWQVFAGKVLAALTYTFAALLLLRRRRRSSLGGLIWGFDPLISLSGTRSPLGRALLADRRRRRSPTCCR